ncbi:hypothetical protein LTR91_013608 [Friedmanniomyces endolithicus]|nr:hypothetical protein LTS09_014028 [Friedmanniomyces endolithicus]KAK0275913.1 hypothetical protein LTR35_010682 [Friedmanniomyces endolithicus]KAK0292358.1 hypothetical protein LTS00_007835 [Friedmanniomyces endolithicus]KAK0309196.1 hypothetical protein LTR82_015248 [Friedmanniomyces endolithicus]KAK0311979.1 hypothetical protein LTR01_002893 [Friedmanniomyces endolithicus]
MALEAFNMHRALRNVHNELWPQRAEQGKAPGINASVEAQDPTRPDHTPADDASSCDEDPFRSPPSSSPDPGDDTPTHPTNSPVIHATPRPNGLKRRHSSPSLDPTDDLPCPDLRRAYKRLRTEHATCRAIEHNLRIRLQVLDEELARAVAERDEAREDCLAARRRARLGEEELWKVRLEMERHEGVVCLAVGVVSMVCSGWVGIQIGRELM